MNTTKAKLHMNIDESLKEQLRRLAEQDKRTLSTYVELVLERHVKEQERKSATPTPD